MMKSVGIIAISLTVAGHSHADSNDLSLRYNEPAELTEWEQAVPLGNGRLGAMVFGGTEKERIILNEDSLWGGWHEPKSSREGAFEALKKVRLAIKEGDIKSASDIAMRDFCSLSGYGKPDFGAYQSFCDVDMDIGHDFTMVKNYKRDLNLKNAVATVSYSYKGVDYKREIFSSYPDQVTVMRLTASKPGSISFGLSLSSLHRRVDVIGGVNELVLTGNVFGKKYKDRNGMEFGARLQVMAMGGTVVAEQSTKTVTTLGRKMDKRNDFLTVSKADTVTIIIAGATDYELKYPSYKGDIPKIHNDKTLAALKGKSFKALRSAHVADYQTLFNRVEIDLGAKSRNDLPTNERLKAYKKDHTDRGLEELLFQYGRYLLISSSRPGAMPANLQGLWNKSNSPPWNCDYHLNINFQMNYWPVDSCNLSECAEPMVRWTKDLAISGRKTAKEYYHCPGWVTHLSGNVWGSTSPGPKRGIHMLEPEGAAFLCQNMWDHFAYTQDMDYLKNDAWPLLKGAAEFWLANLQEIEGGYLAASPSYSPEHGPLSDGAYYSTMIVYDLFTNCIQATKALDIDHDFAKTLLKKRNRLQPLKIGQYGQLQEWRDPKLEAKSNKSRHRHVSHMYAIYPGRQIIPGKDIKLTKAALQSMKFRGDAATGWSMGWKINLWARFLDGDHAHKLVQKLISSKLYDNLWDKHPPFQIDGNFGATAGIAEMLVQSHTPEICLLPALPKVWHTGSVKGLRARGGYTVGLTWEKGALVAVTIKADKAGNASLRYGKHVSRLSFKPGQIITLNGVLK